MAAPKGHKRYGGREKGTPNKKTQDLMAKCEARGIDIFDALLDYVQQPSTMELRFAALKEIAQYLFPKRKAIEHSGELENTITVVVKDYTSKKSDP